MIDHLDAAHPAAAAVRIVPASPDDARRLAGAWRRAFGDDPARYGGGPPAMDDPATHRRLIDESHYHALTVDGRLVGGLCMVREHRSRWRLASIFVDPDHQRRGLGSRLMEFVPLGHTDVQRVELDAPFPHPSGHFFESHGYRLTGRRATSGHDEDPDPDDRLAVYSQDFPGP
jgi:GNAT superfamily N-acetyltransferase